MSWRDWFSIESWFFTTAAAQGLRDGTNRRDILPGVHRARLVLRARLVVYTPWDGAHAGGGIQWRMENGKVWGDALRGGG